MAVNMIIEVIRIEEYDDGSADMEVHIDAETKLFLINHAIIDILKKSLNQFKEQFNDNVSSLEESDIEVKFKWTNEKDS